MRPGSLSEPAELLVVECKSYLFSEGVRLASFDANENGHDKHCKPFKIFNNQALFNVVRAPLDLTESKRFPDAERI